MASRVCAWKFLTGKNKGKQCLVWTNIHNKYCDSHYEKGIKLDEQKEIEEEKIHMMLYGMTRAQSAANKQRADEEAARAKAEAELKEFVEQHGMSPDEYNRKIAEETELAARLAEEKRIADLKVAFSDEQYCIDTFTQFVIDACKHDINTCFEGRVVKCDEHTGIITACGKRYVIKVCKLD